MSVWQRAMVAADGTHHLLDGQPLYAARFDEVLKYHVPGLAPVRDASGAYHIDEQGRPAYTPRFLRTFGFYEGRAAVRTAAGWIHILRSGEPLYEDRHGFCGNYQGGRVVVRDRDGGYYHLREDGSPAYPQRHRYVGDFRDGIAVVQDRSGRHTHVDRDGRAVHGRTFLDLDVFHKGRARARDEQGWMHINLRGEPVYSRRFAMVEPFYNGQARVERADGALLVIDEGGEPVLELRPSLRSELHALSAELVGFWRTQTLCAAVESGLVAALPGTEAELAARCALPQRSCARLLRPLRELKVVDVDAGRWEATTRGALLLPGSDSLANAASLWGREHYQAWGQLVGALRTEKAAFIGESGGGWFEHIAGQRELLVRYHQALAAYARHDYRVLPEQVDLSAHTCVIDAGGGTGELLFNVLRECAALEGVLLDRPEVISEAQVPRELTGRCRLIEGDLFGPWPVQADAVVLARVLHDWSDDQVVEVLQRARAALLPGGRIYIVEMLLTDEAGDGGLLDLNMLVMTGGAERSAEAFRALLSRAGLQLLETRPLTAPNSVLVVTVG